MANYVFADWISAAVGIANSTSGNIDARGAIESKKNYLAVITMTAPESFGAMKGSTLSIGYNNGQQNGAFATTQNLYIGGTIATPVTGLTVGLAYDYQSNGLQTGSWAQTFAMYLSFQATEKLKLNARGDFAKGSVDTTGLGVFYNAPGANYNNLFAFTLTADYSLWENVVTRAELRWDKDIGGDNPFNSTTGTSQSLTALVSATYKF